MSYQRATANNKRLSFSQKELAKMTATLKAYKSREFDGLLDEIKSEIAIEDNEIEEKDNNDALSIVSADNVISNISTKFHYIRQLGNGASCHVFKARNVQNNKLYAVKELIKKHAINLELFRKEVELLKKLIHPNILQYFDCFEDDNNYYIATGFCSGGTMLDKIIRMKFFSEQKASKYIGIILSAVNYLHSLNIVHRDLKAQNMVFDKPGNSGILQLIDFGDSRIIDEDETYDEFVGTIHYVPPEIIRSRTGKELKKSDVWSIGVITYLLVCGMVPFRGKNNKEILTNIVRKRRKIKYPKDSYLTDSCKDFIKSLLCRDINKRLSASEALQHPWICGNMASTANLSSNFLRCLKDYKYGNKLQNILVNAILTEMNEDEQETLNEGILAMNRNSPEMNGDNVVDYLLLNTPISSPISTQIVPEQKRMSLLKLDPLQENGFVFEDEMDWDCLQDLNVDEILDKVEQKEKELGDNEIDDQFVFDEDESEDYHEDEYKVSKMVSSPSTELSVSASFDGVDILNRKISIPRFKAIMKRSDKKYNVEEIVNDLDDGMGNIALNDIASYHKEVDTMDDVSCLINLDEAEVILIE